MKCKAQFCSSEAPSDSEFCSNCDKLSSRIEQEAKAEIDRDIYDAISLREGIKMEYERN